MPQPSLSSPGALSAISGAWAHAHWCGNMVEAEQGDFMNTKRTAWAVAASGTAAGIVGLVVMAMPASAGGPPPALPPISAESLVQSVMTAHIPAASGTVSIKENLGMPIPLLPSGGSDGVAARVYSDGTGKARIQLTKQMSETTIVEDGSTLWIWDSADKSVRKISHGDA